MELSEADIDRLLCNNKHFSSIFLIVAFSIGKSSGIPDDLCIRCDFFESVWESEVVEGFSNVDDQRMCSFWVFVVVDVELRVFMRLWERDGVVAQLRM